MAFRHGGFKGKGLVYSRRRGQGKMVNRSLRDGSSIIYEENEGESDSFEMNTPDDIRQNTSISRTGSILKDKSNITRSPKPRSERQLSQRNEIVDDAGTTGDAPDPRGRRLAKKTTLMSVKKPKNPRSKEIPSSPPIPVPTEVIEPEIELPITEREVPVGRDFNQQKTEPALSAYSDVPSGKNSRRPDMEGNSDRVEDVPSTLHLQKQFLRRSSREQETVAITKFKAPSSALVSSYPTYSRFTDNCGKSISERKGEDNRRVFLNWNEEEDTLERARLYWGGADNDVGLDDGELQTDEQNDLTTNESPKVVVSLVVQTNSHQQSPAQIHSSPSFEPDNAFPNQIMDEPQIVVPDLPTATPPEQSTGFQFWRTPSRKGEKIGVPTPSPNRPADDFIFQRRESNTNTADRDIEQDQFHNEVAAVTNQKKGERKGSKEKSNRQSKVKEKESTSQGNKWIKFMDFELSCPSDESDDELAFCKPSWTKGTMKDSE